MTEDKRQMKASQIPAFVDEVIKAGCNICAVSHDRYVIGDIEEQHRARDELDRISERYGNRDPLKLEIVAYLWSIGRYVDLETEGTRHCLRPSR
ncbi:hypothetical protein [Sinorhizobium sp. NFACC03]|uniref:hypothetical protein n=1 Tax=Sinorhizobium sp. NFACC03 TaxID=1566295 RepID=UPI000891361D|nr:hypothetical protein [Sinorhizobium sp. NFACC03]SDA58722.1 hypothetical protein SAMN03159448_01556 [Sinorhizobium sp. NFACC03]